ncbi:RNA 2',3'-cyclic phosphodiesterase [Lysobacter cavernae]|uniref:RNA 2',3'-cyclic phosphodiesterase n=1 Tax=Lysobacter cavernae TaxID=1685901 RepID=A0ABV7RUR1_9GAMM
MDLSGIADDRGHGDVHRLFFALWPDDSVRQRIADAASSLRQTHSPGGRWLGPHRYHLTLQFLGDFAQLPPTLAARACDAAAALRSPAFTLPLDRAGSFRNRSIPWWLGCQDAPQALTGLWDALGLALARAGVKVHSGGKALQPHVTVLRDADRGLPSTPIAPLHWPVTEFVLIHSQLGRRNAYDIVQRWSLMDQ